ncbi:uncharacterized protein LOC101786921 [Setaria italica]|nr:uncharacterized protein LOC101786921 [Setaria italica]
MVMDRASWLWRRKSSDKSPGGSDSSMSVSSHSEQCSDDQGQSPEASSRNRYDYSQQTGAARSLNGKLAAGVNLNDSSPENGQSVEQHVSSNVRDEEVKETVRSLNEKLSAALLTIRAKEDLVKQHAKVTEEAVAGWEQAEAEVTALKGLLEASCQKNASLQDQVSHLDEALKECVRQLRLAREEQEDKIREIVSKKSQVPQSENSELQNHITELKKRLEVTRSEASSSMLLQHNLQEKLQVIEKENLDLKAKLQATEKENMDLKAKLLVQSKDLKILMLERDLSNKAAETASKQHLESVKKIARVEAECRRLHHLTRKPTLINDSRPTQNNGCMESLTDSQSDHGEHMVAVDNDLRNSDSWASALIAELDQFKNGKDGSRNLVNNPVEIDIMDDFLEMERLAALPESDRTSSNFETDSDKAVARSFSLKVETEELQNQVTDLQQKFDAIESEKRELEMTLMEVRNQLDISCDALVAAKNRLVEMQMQLDSENNSKLAALEDVERLDSERKALELQLESKSVEVEELLMAVTSMEENAGQKELESQLELMSAEATELRLTVASLEERIQAERALSVQHKEKEEAMWNAKEDLEAQLSSANTEMGKLHDIVKALENEVKREKTLHEELTAQLQVKMEAAVCAVKESLEVQLCSANTEAGKLRGVVKELENEVEKEKALHEELAAQIEVKTEAARTAKAVKESLEAKLCSANAEIQKLQDITKALQSELEKEKALYEELSTQLEMKIEAERTRSVESAKESLEEQLQLVNSEAANLRDMVTALEHDVEKEKIFSAELQMQLEALEAIKKVLESEAESALQDARNLNQKVESLEAKLEDQMSSAEEFTAKAEALQSEKMAMEHKLKTADRELIKLTNKVSLLHREIEQERLLSEEYEQKCQKLEAQLSRDSRDAKLWRLANSNGDLKAKKEKELANAAGKLAECQKTIASLEHQLKSLTDLDSVVLEPERLESSRDMHIPLPLDFRNGDAEFAMFADDLYDFDLPNSNTSCFSPLPSIQPSSPPSEMSVFAGGLSTLSSYRSKRASRRKPASGTEEWRRNADTHKMSAEEVRAAGVEASMRPPGRGPGEVLHQRGRLPYGPGTMALVGFGIVGAIGFLVLYQKARPGTPATEVAKVAVGHGDPAAGREPPDGARQGKNAAAHLQGLRKRKCRFNVHLVFPPIHAPRVPGCGCLSAASSSSSMGLFSSPAKVYKPAADVDLGPGSDEFYISPNVKAPRVAGLLVKIFVWILEMPIVGQIVLYILKKDNLINKLVSDADIPEPPLFTATHSWEDIPEQNVRLIKPDLSAAERVQEAAGCLPARLEATLAAGAASSGLKRWTIRDFADAYSSGETTPVQVATRFLAAVKESSGPDLNMAFFISCDPEDVMRQAEESTRRYQRGAALSALDGVLVAVKDEMDCVPYPTTGGTRWLAAARRCEADAACVAQLRACGAVLAGKANMHELGAGTSGINPQHGSARNPYNSNKIAGGSSSGSAAVVSAGLCPVALGVDGGGSVRMPAALCGIVGFKPTAGRLSNAGVLPLNWTVGMPGILAGTVEDALIAYSAIVDQSQPSYLRPELNLPQLKSTLSMSNIKLAKYAKWFNDSAEDIRSCCDKALKTLQAHYGWQTVDVTIPEIEEMRLAHYVTIGSECTTSLAKYLDKLKRSEIGWDARVALSVYGSFSSRAYLNSQRLRNRQMYFHKEIFKTADVIVSPMTGVTAYTLQDDAFNTGELDYINGAALVRYSIAGNFLGLPAITVMVGHDKGGLPIGLQFIGRPWSEATLLHIAFAMQEACAKGHKKPAVFYDLLKKE